MTDWVCGAQMTLVLLFEMAGRDPKAKFKHFD